MNDNLYVLPLKAWTDEVLSFMNYEYQMAFHQI